jgi:tetratricopeptide (TPR) repeat protein
MAHAEMLDARTAPAGDTAAAGRAAGWNRTAERWFATTRVPAVLWEQREDIATAAGDAELTATVPADRPGGSTRTDLYVRAVRLAAAGEFARAVPLLVELADREKDLYAAHFALGVCYYKTSQHPQALERFLMARALAPRDYRPSYNRGLVLLYLLRHKEAEAEFTDALGKNPRYADAYWHRALARRRLGAYAGAVEDLTRGLDAGSARLSALLVRAEMYDRLKNPAAAAADRAAASTLEPRLEQDLITRGVMRMAKDPAGALADFDRAIAANPRSLPAWENKAVALSEYKRQPEAALEILAKVIEFYPEYGPARMTTAVLLARLGRRADAHREAERALLLSADPRTVYQAANVYALTSADHPEDRPRALHYLRQALRDGFRDFDIADADADMANIRELPEYGQALRAARELAR